MVSFVGHKIGLTSHPMRKASKMSEPDYGRILADAARGAIGTSSMKA